MNTIIDDNFLGGNLTITIDESKRSTIGRLVIYDKLTDNILNFNYMTICHQNDKYNIYKGIKIVKLKLSQKYYKYIKNHQKNVIDKYSNTIKQAQNNLTHINSKLYHIQFELDKFK